MLPTLPQSHQEELLDAGNPDPVELLESLRDLSRVNRWGGGNRSILSHLGPRLAAWPQGREVRILDVGAGGADIARALVKFCRRRGIRVWIVGLDRGRRILGFARGRLADSPEIVLVRGDAHALPFLPASFDFVYCSLLLHHLPAARVPAFLRGLSRLARQAALVSDLRRGRWEYFWTYLFMLLFLRSRMSRNDAPLSVLRSLTLPEAKTLAMEAGWSGGRIEKTFPLRLFLIDRPPP